MNIAIRADISKSIGTGHLMRCLTLASELRRRGVHVRFLVRDLPEYFKSMLSEKGIEFVVLVAQRKKNPDDATKEVLSQKEFQCEDIYATNKALADKTWDWLIVDH